MTPLVELSSAVGFETVLLCVWSRTADPRLERASRSTNQTPPSGSHFPQQCKQSVLCLPASPVLQPRTYPQRLCPSQSSLKNSNLLMLDSGLVSVKAGLERHRV